MILALAGILYFIAESNASSIPTLEETLRSPVSASGFGRLDAINAVHDILNSDRDSEKSG